MFRPRQFVFLTIVLAATTLGAQQIPQIPQPLPSGHTASKLDHVTYEAVMPVNGKGGSDISGPYVPVRNWPQPLQDGRVFGFTATVFALSPDRVIVGVRNTKEPWPIPSNWDMREAFAVLAADHLTAFRNPQQTHKLSVLNRDGAISDYWEQWDQTIPNMQFIRVNADDPQGHVYITGRGMVMKFTRDGERLVYTIGTDDVPTREGQERFGPEGMTFHPDGGFYVVSKERVIRFSKDGEYLSEFGKAGSGPGEFNDAHDLFFDREGRRIYVADKDNHRIQVFDENGRHLDTWPNIVGPAVIRMTEDRKYIWTVGLYTAKFLKFDLNGRLQASWGTQGFGPGGITGGIHDFSTDSEGNLYIADHGDTVQKLRPHEDGNPAELLGQLLPY